MSSKENLGHETNSTDQTMSVRLRTEAEVLITKGDYAAALKLLDRVGYITSALNLRGVCLMRLGRFPAAVNLYRSFVLKSGCTWTRNDLPDVHKVNFATALLLNGHPGGCVEVLSEISNQKNPHILSLRATLKQWESTLSWWPRLAWRFGHMEPEAAPPAINLPGHFETAESQLGISVARPSTDFARGQTNTNTAV